MTQLNRMPTYSESLETGSVTTRGWFSFWAGLFSGQPTGSVAAIRLDSSPFAYPAPAGGSVIVNGGSVSQVQFSRDGDSFFVTGQTQGMFPVSQGDQLVVTYASAPTMSFVPR